MKQTIVLLTWFLVLTKVATDKHPLHVGALFELSNHWFANYVNFFVNIIEHAFEEIGNRSDILADYSLQLIAKDTQVICYSKFAKGHFYNVMSALPS